jgi:hypothetical protein
VGGIELSGESTGLARRSSSDGWHDGCLPGGVHPSAGSRTHMAVQFRTSGCLMSIVASVVLTIVLNLALRACAG